MDKLRSIPSVEKLLQAAGTVAVPRAMVVQLARALTAELRKSGEAVPFEEAVAQLRKRAEELRLSRLSPVINGTGVIIHTNLGRSPMAEAAQEALQSASANYNNLEINLTTGERGSRAGYLDALLALLCGAEAALVTNNCAAALVLILRHFTRGEKKEVIISRGELVQIGGGFRIPEILEASGALLKEIGTTNKTALADYARAAGRGTGLFLKVHRSNFFMKGFVESVGTGALAELARRKKIPLIEDLGSGALAQTDTWAGLDREPTPAECLKNGADLVCFSGDKLLGGPQSGIIVGKGKWIRELRRDPFYRALRCDKLVLTALQATAELYASGQLEKIPILAMMRTSVKELRARGESIMGELKIAGQARLTEVKTQVGGGTLPESAIPSLALELRPEKIPIDRLASLLRAREPSIVGYVASGSFRLDLRTIFPRQDKLCVESINEVIAK